MRPRAAGSCKYWCGAVTRGAVFVYVEGAATGVTREAVFVYVEGAATGVTHSSLMHTKCAQYLVLNQISEFLNIRTILFGQDCDICQCMAKTVTYVSVWPNSQLLQ